MDNPLRVTNPLLDVLEVFISALGGDKDLHGWAIMKATKRSGPTVYGILDRLEDMGWITGEWESENPDPSRPRRRFYRITPTGHASATQLLLKYRPQSLQRGIALRPGLATPNWRGALPQGGTA